MSLLQKIRDDALQSRKNRDNITSALLITLGSEAALVGFNDGKRESTDEEVMAVIKKFLKGNTEVLSVRPNDEVALKEREILESYLPKQLSEDELRAAILGIAQEAGIKTVTPKDTGVIMKALQSRYTGQYNGASASQIIKTL